MLGGAAPLNERRTQTRHGGARQAARLLTLGRDGLK